MWPILLAVSCFILIPTHGSNLIAVSTNPPSACTCTATNGECTAPLSGCLHGHLLKVHRNSTWITTNMTWTAIIADPGDIPPACLGPKVQGQWLVCALYVPTSGRYGLTIDDISLTLDFVAPEIMLFDETKYGCHGAPGIALTDCYHGSVLRLQHVGMGAYAGSYIPGAYSPIELQFTGRPGAAECLLLTVDSIHITCQLAVAAESPLTLEFNLKQLTNSDATVSGTIDGNKTLVVFTGKGIPLNSKSYPLKGNLTITSRFPYVESLSGDCKSLGLVYNPKRFEAIGCVHGGHITIHGFGFHDPSFLFITNVGVTGPACYTTEIIGTTDIICAVDLAAATVTDAEYGIALNSMIYNSKGQNYTAAANSQLRIVFATPTLTDLHANGACLMEDSTLLTGCPGMTLFTITGMGFYSPNVTLNVLEFITDTGTQPSPTAHCFAISLTSISCELEVPDTIAPAERWQVIAHILGLRVETDLHLDSPIAQPTKYPYQLAYATAATISDNLVYVIGGQTGEGTPVSTVMVYDTQVNSNYSAAPSLPITRGCASAVGVPDTPTNANNGSRIYIFGGTSNAGNESCMEKYGDRSILVYDAANNSWSQLLSRIPATPGIREARIPMIINVDSIAGIMFDVQVLDEIVVQGMKVHLGVPNVTTIRVYYKKGTYKGAQESDWTFVSQDVMISVGPQLQQMPTPFSISLYPGGLHDGIYAFYVTSDHPFGMAGHHDDVITSISPHLNMLTGQRTGPDFYATGQPAGFLGALMTEQEAVGCMTWDSVPNLTLAEGSRHVYSYSHPFQVDEDSQVTLAELTVIINASAPVAFTSLRLELVRETGATLSLTNGASLALKWNSAGTAYYTFTDFGVPIQTHPGTNGSTSPLAPYYIKPTSSLLTFFSSPISAGTIYLRINDTSVDGIQFTLVAFELHLCQEQPGLTGAASALVGDEIYTVGGVGAGNFSYFSGDDTALGSGLTIQSAVHTDGLSAIDDIKVGVYVTGVFADNLQLRLTVPYDAADGLIGQWLADGTLSDTTTNARQGYVQHGPANFLGEESCRDYGYAPLTLQEDYVILPYIPKPQVESRTFWLKVSPSQQSSMAILGWGNARPRWPFSMLSMQAGQIVFEEAQDLYVSCTVSSVSAPYNDDQWHFFAMTRDATNTVTLYVDGLQVGAAQCTSVVADDDLDSLGIGRHQSYRRTSDLFTGSLFDVRLYNVALTAAQCTQLYQAGCGGRVVPLLTTTIGTDNTEFGLQTFTATGTNMSSNNFPSVSDPSIVFRPEGKLEAITSVGGGCWQLSVVNNGVAIGKLVNWALQISGRQLYAMSGTVALSLATEPPTFEAQQFGPLVQSRYGHGLVAVGPYLYAIGGTMGDTSALVLLDSVELMDTTHDIPGWRKVASLNYARYLPAVASAGQMIYVAGGYGPTGLLTSVEQYDARTGVWTVLGPIKKVQRSLLYGRLGAFFTAAYDRLYIGGGINWRGKVVDTIDSVDMQAKEECWMREAGIDLLAGCNCSTTSRKCGAPGWDYSRGFFYIPAVASEAACADECDSQPLCYAYTYRNGGCYGRLEVGHSCLRGPLVGAASGTRNCRVPEWTIQATAGDAVGQTYVFFDVEVDPNVTLTLKGLTIGLLIAKPQKLRLYYQMGSYANSVMPWTVKLVPSGVYVTPASVGTYRVVLPQPLTLPAGLHGFYLTAELPRSLAFVSGAVYQDYDVVSFAKGGFGTALWALPDVAASGIPQVALHFAPYAPRPTRTSCFTAPSGTNFTLERSDLPSSTAGFSIFARFQTSSRFQRQGLLWKTGPSGVQAHGGIAVSLIGGYLQVQTISGWQAVGPAIAANTHYNVQLSFNGADQWQVVIGSQVFYFSSLAVKQTAMRPIYVGSEAGNAVWQGTIQHVVIDCSGPGINVSGFYPLVGQWGIQSQAGQYIRFAFDEDIVVIGGNVGIITSIFGGIDDGTYLNSSFVDVSNTYVNVTRREVSVLLPTNFTYGVRHQVALDIGLVSRASDAGVYSGMLVVDPLSAAWWFAVSPQYGLDRCAGQPCAVCSSCAYQYTRGDGHKVYWCYMQTQQAGLVEVQRLDVERLPTWECP